MGSEQGRRARRTALAAVVLFALAGCAGTGSPLLSAFSATLAAHDSATVALEQWCAARRIATPPRITATALPVTTAPEPADARAMLEVQPDSPLAYRHVRLTCGPATLSVARNWYVPDRLTAAMNHTLATTREPFGKVTSPLGFRRERLGTLPRGSRDCPHGTVLAHRALLRRGDGTPLALLVECYTRANLRG